MAVADQPYSRSVQACLGDRKPEEIDMWCRRFALLVLSQDLEQAAGSLVHVRNQVTDYIRQAVTKAESIYLDLGRYNILPVNNHHTNEVIYGIFSR